MLRNKKFVAETTFAVTILISALSLKYRQQPFDGNALCFYDFGDFYNERNEPGCNDKSCKSLPSILVSKDTSPKFAQAISRWSSAVDDNGDWPALFPWSTDVFISEPATLFDYFNGLKDAEEQYLSAKTWRAKFINSKRNRTLDRLYSFRAALDAMMPVKDDCKLQIQCINVLLNKESHELLEVDSNDDVIKVKNGHSPYITRKDSEIVFGILMTKLVANIFGHVAQGVVSDEMLINLIENFNKNEIYFLKPKEVEAKLISESNPKITEALILDEAHADWMFRIAQVFILYVHVNAQRMQWTLRDFTVKCPKKRLNQAALNTLKVIIKTMPKDWLKNRPHHRAFLKYVYKSMMKEIFEEFLQIKQDLNTIASKEEKGIDTKVKLADTMFDMFEQMRDLL